MRTLDVAFPRQALWEVDLTISPSMSGSRCAATMALTDAPTPIRPEYWMGTSTGENIMLSDGDASIMVTVSQPVAAPAPWTISQVRDFSGLTASQLARLFSVSRRSINNWLTGGPMAPHHQERLSVIVRALTGLLTGRTSAERRAQLLDSSHGPSVFHQLLAQVSGGPTLQGSALRAGDQLGA